MKAKDAVLEILNEKRWRSSGSTQVDASSLFPIQIAEVLNKKRPQLDYAPLDFDEDFGNGYSEDRIKWHSELLTVASNRALPFDLRKAALSGFPDPGEEGWANEELDAVIVLLEDPSVPPLTRLQLAESYTAYSDPIGAARNYLYASIIGDAKIDIQTRASVATSMRVGTWLPPEGDSKHAAEQARVEFLDWIVSRNLFETLNLWTRIRVDAMVNSASGVLDLARIADVFDESRASVTEVLRKLSTEDALEPDARLLAHRLWHGMVGPVAQPEQQHVFISYVSEDAAMVSRLERDLRALGVNGWLDKQRLKPGQRWRDRLRQAIREGAAFIAIFSPASESRERSYMREELNLAVEELRHRPRDRTWFIPVLLSAVALPDLNIGPNEFLSDIQYISLQKNWDEKVVALARAILEINA
jgi:hypothetical protein